MNYTHKPLRNFFLFTSSFLLAALAAAAANAATPEVTSVTMEQAAATREVTISYTLDNAPAVVTLDIQTNATVNGEEVWTSIGGEHIWNAEGAVWRKVTTADLQNGSYKITWRPDLSWPDHKIDADGVRAVVTAWALNNPPDYMVADISAGARPNTQRYYPAVEFLPGSVLGQTGAVTNNPAYKISMLVMRKIMAKSVIWTMGSTATEPKHQSNEATHLVSLDSNYYIGIFEITQSQWGLIATNSTMASAFKDLERKGERAMDGPTFNEIRNTHRTSSVTDNQRLDVSAGPDGVYPAAPSDDSFLGLLRLRTGLDFDLPGEAQWEFACRAGHGDGKYGDGSTILTGTGSGEVNLARIARFPGNCNNKCNGSKQGTPFTDTNIPWNTTSCDAKAAIGGTAVVGSYAPNDWGLYDMLGNLNEYCLDFYVDNIAALAGAVNTTDPGTATGNGILRVIRGGCAYYGDATWCRPAYRSSSGSGHTRIFCGFRVVCPRGRPIAGETAMNLAMKTAAAVCLLAAILAVGGASATPVPRKKCIACGWEFGTVSPAQLLANADKFADTAIDGVGIYLLATNSAGRKIDTHGFTSDQEWDFEAFADQLPALKQIARTDHLRESFIKCFNAPKKRIPWTDDAEWARIARNMGVAGRLLRETGLKGVCCDPEDYHGQGQYRRAGDDPPYDELAKTVRQRGREVFGALFREQPEAKVLFYWFLTFDISYFSAPNPREAAREAGDLWPAFADGIMDVLPPEAVIIDGDEHAYGYTCDGSNFHLSATRQRQFAPLLLSPENRAKHAAQVQVGFGFYLDYYASRKPEGSTFFKPVEGSMTERFRRNYLDGGRIADEYVWLWGEWLRTVDWEGAPIQKHITERKWSEALPGIYEAMVDLNRPGFGFPQRRAALEAEGEMRDLNPNPGFTPESGAAPDAIPAPYGIYNGNEKTEIRLAKEGDGDDASLSMTAQKGSSRAVTCFVKDLLPGDVLLVTCRAKGNVRIVPGWQGRRGTGEYGWLWGLGNMPPLKFSDPDESGWRTAEAYLVVPGCADGLGFDIKPGETGREVLVDNLHVWKLW